MDHDRFKLSPSGYLSSLTLALLVATSCQKTAPVEGQLPASDSIAVRVLYKGWGGEETAECISEDWGWDSLTWRLAAGSLATVTGHARDVHFQLTRLLASDSAMLAYRPGEVFPVTGSGPWPLAREYPQLDSIVVSTRPTRFTTRTVDGGWYYSVRTVPSWPELVRKPDRTTTLFGKVVDATSGRSIYVARVVVLGTKVGVLTDRVGRFTLTGVPIGSVRLDACAGCYLKTHIEVHAPSDSLVIPLRRKPGCTYPD